MSGPADDYVVRPWIEKAEEDLSVAAILLSTGEAGIAEAVCFHAQQGVEKYLKAILTQHEVYFPKTHDLNVIVALLPRPEEAPMTPRERRRLTRYATVMRYPGDYDPSGLDEAREAVEIAQRVRAALRPLLPPETGCDAPAD